MVRLLRYSKTFKLLGCILDYFKVIPSKKKNEKLTCSLSFSWVSLVLLFHKKSKFKTLCVRRFMSMRLLTNLRQETNKKMTATVTVIRSNSWTSLIRKLRKKVSFIILSADSYLCTWKENNLLFIYCNPSMTTPKKLTIFSVEN